MSKGDCIIMADFNHGNIKWDSLESTGVEDQRFLCLVQDNFLTQHVLEPTRAARVLYIVLSSQKEFVDNVVIQEPLGSSDHNQLHFNINIKSDETKVKQCRRNFRKGNYKEIRKSLAIIDWNDKMKNKTATACWNILRGGLDSAIDSYVPMKKQGKRYKKKHLSKEAFRKIRYKPNMYRVYKHTGKDKDYDAYKEELNAATNEVRKSKRNVEHKLAQNIKSDSKRFYAYVRSKQNVRDRVGPLEDRHHHHEQSDVTCCTLTELSGDVTRGSRILHLAFHSTRSRHIDSSFSMAFMSRRFMCMSLLDRSC